jgi:hypothetical protein
MKNLLQRMIKAAQAYRARHGDDATEFLWQRWDAVQERRNAGDGCDWQRLLEEYAAGNI